MKRLTDIFIREMFPMKKMKDGFSSLAIMFITSEEIAHMVKNGGNPLGLKPEDGNLMRAYLALRSSTNLNYNNH